MQGIMLTKRLFIYVLLASSLLLNGWSWFISPVRVKGRIDQFHSQAVIRRGSDDYSVVNINLTSSGDEAESM
jgi:hypothetical protein